MIMHRIKQAPLSFALALGWLCLLHAKAGGACVAPDAVRFPVSWQGDAADHNCTADEVKGYDRLNFAFTCSAVNCQMKYGTDTSTQVFAFDSACRECVQCADPLSSDCNVASVIVDDGCVAIDTCQSSIDCGVHGTNLGLYACECDEGFKTDVASGVYCSAVDVTGQEGGVNTTNAELDETGTDIVIAVSVIASVVAVVAVCVGALSINVRGKRTRTYPSGRPIDADPRIVTYNKTYIRIDGEQSPVIRELLNSITWPVKSLPEKAQV